jgi:hypothetical protein
MAASAHFRSEKPSPTGAAEAFGFTAAETAGRGWAFAGAVVEAEGVVVESGVVDDEGEGVAEADGALADPCAAMFVSTPSLLGGSDDGSATGDGTDVAAVGGATSALVSGAATVVRVERE